MSDKSVLNCIEAANEHAASAHRAFEEAEHLVKEGYEHFGTEGNEQIARTLRRAEVEALTSIALSLTHIMHDQCQSLHGGDSIDLEKPSEAAL